MKFMVREIVQEDEPAVMIDAESVTDAVQQYFDARPDVLDGYTLMEVTGPGGVPYCYWAHVGTIIGDTPSPTG
jgi:hypothetical protein